MKLLKDLLKDLSAQTSGPVDIPITDIVFDSRKVKPGSLFVALRGVHADGHRFIPVAAAAGAKAIVAEEKADVPGVTQVIVSDALKALAPLALRFWDSPSQKLLMVGITGTNGKTTASYLIESILEAAGLSPAVLGTINYRYNHKTVPAPNTTPFASELQRFLADSLADGAKACIMEVSSHALALNRVEGVDFDVAVFTNLTQDHLDFHQTVEEYGAAKRKLFEGLTLTTRKPYLRMAVVNRDDPWAGRMQAASRVPVIGFGLKNTADVTAVNKVSDASGSRFEIHSKWLGRSIQFPVKLVLPGDYNVSNALAAAAVALGQGLSSDIVKQGLENVRGVPGRMERVDAGQPYTVIVDYAHTEDALRNVLTALRRLQPKRLLTVFGCGGDRDRTKRPLMGEVAARLSDEIILTSDNPRSEDPSRITLDVEVGIRRVRTDHYQIIVDRQEAIGLALQQAQPGDIVLIAGKGHETYQILGDKTISFDDREVARAFLRS